LEAAREAAKAAGKLLMKSYGKATGIREKARRDLVTDADGASERLIISMLRKECPDFGFLAEESGSSGSGSEYTWVIDPLDGTTNFAFGLPYFAVSIALVKGRSPVLGVMDVPVLGEQYRAVRGGGAFLNGRRLEVSRRKKPGEMMALFNLGPADDKFSLMDIAGRIRGSFFSVKVIGAAVLELAWISAGRADAFVACRTKPWDIAAACLLVDEAGGRATDFAGKPWSPWSKDLVVSNGKAHDEILRIVRG